MGNKLLRWRRPLHYSKNWRVLFIGLDNAGKSTLFGNIVGESQPKTEPTLQSVYKEVEFRGKQKKHWLLATDVGGKADCRPAWRHYYTGLHGLVFVVDSVNKDSFEQVKEEILLLLVDEQLRETPILIFANKQDANDAVSVNEVQMRVLPDKSSFKSLHHGDLRVFGGSAMTGEGVFEAVDWLCSQMKRT